MNELELKNEIKENTEVKPKGKKHYHRPIYPDMLWKYCLLITALFWFALVIILALGSWFPPPKEGELNFTILQLVLQFGAFSMFGLTFGHTFMEYFLKK